MKLEPCVTATRCEILTIAGKPNKYIDVSDIVQPGSNDPVYVISGSVRVIEGRIWGTPKVKVVKPENGTFGTFEVSRLIMDPNECAKLESKGEVIKQAMYAIETDEDSPIARTGDRVLLIIEV